MSFIQNLLAGIQETLEKCSLNIGFLELFFKWIKQKLTFIQITQKHQKPRFLLKGDLYWCNFGLNVGSEFSSVTATSNNRPCLIIRNNAFIHSNNIVVIPLTSFHEQKKIVFTDIVIDPSPVNGLKGKSIIKTANIRDVSIVRIGQKIGTLETMNLREVENKLLDLFDIKK